MTVDIVAHLLALVAKNGIPAARECHLHQIRQKTVQLNPGVRWPRQTAASKDPHLHVEIAPIFLRDEIRRRFRSAEQRMQRLVDPAGLGDAREIFRPRVVVPLLQLHERNLVGRIAINLVRAQKYEYRLGRMLARRFQEIYRAERIHLEIDQGNLSGLFVRRLRRAVHDQIEALRSKEFFDGRSVANVQRRVGEPLGHGLQPLQIPERVARRAEENPPHVVIHAHNFMSLPVEMLDRFRTNQSAAAGDQNFHPFESIPLPMGRKSINAVDFPRTAFLKWLNSGREGHSLTKKSTSSRAVF